MRWEDERESNNVEDVRGQDGGGGGGGGGLGGMFGLLGLLPLLGRGGGVVVVLIVLGAIFVPRLLSGGGQTNTPAAVQSSTTPGPDGAARGEDDDTRFIRKVTAYTEDTWGRIFATQGRQYTPPIVTLYSSERATGCGEGQAAMGPFYCPADHHVYLDLSFFRELSGRFGAPGRFAQAYVVAHEVGHHIQTLLGTMQRADAERSAAGQGANPISVRVELQADCYAGVWANQTNRATNFLDPGDEAEALRAASAVGDDTLQKAAQGRVAPDSFTHGSAAQRTRWFDRGFQSGDLARCDTFGGAYEDL